MLEVTFKKILSLIHVLVLVVALWVSTVDFFFKSSGSRDLYSSVYAITIFVLIVDSVSVVFHFCQSNSTRLGLIRLIRKVYVQLVGMIYLSLKIADIPGRHNIGWAFS